MEHCVIFLEEAERQFLLEARRILVVSSDFMTCLDALDAPTKVCLFLLVPVFATKADDDEIAMNDTKAKTLHFIVRLDSI